MSRLRFVCRSTVVFCITAILLLSSLQSCSKSTKSKEAEHKIIDLVAYVDPFIGTQHEGHTFPGAAAPMGMVQPSPESYTTYYEGYEMDHLTGYQFNDPWITGFTQTHLNGVGCPAMSDILLQPYCGHVIDPSERANYKSTYQKESESAEPGYYTVYLDDHHVKVELTASERVAYHRYTYDQPSTAQLLIDLQYGVSWDINAIPDNILDAYQQFEDEQTLTGYRKASVWAERDLYYVIKFSKPVVDKDELEAPENQRENAPRYQLGFDLGLDSVLEVRVGVSTVGIEEAKRNLRGEVPHFDSFDDTRLKTKNKWSAILNKIELKADNEKMTAFYTSLYHLYIQPSNIADIDGKYRSSTDEVLTSSGGKYYSTLSLWDTFRAANPLYTILSPSLVSDVVTSMMDSYTNMEVDPNNPKEANRYLPRWQLWGKETHTMVGNHAVPVIVDAHMKGIKSAGYTDDEIFEAIWTSLTKIHYRNHVQLIDSFGYIPYDAHLSIVDDGRETAARLLEGTTDDYAAALLADRLGKIDEQLFLNNRASYYKNVYDPVSGFMRGKNAAGEFKASIDPDEVVGEWVAHSDYTEGNAYHYQFHVLHDILGLARLMGGVDIMEKELDSLFYSDTQPEVKTLVWNIHGIHGQYWHGNEPCHHVPYLYKFTNAPEKTDKIIKTLVDNYYTNKPDGLKGNDDCGQMSAWYMFAVMGLYPVNPVNGQYILGAPQADEINLNLPNGRYFRIVAKNLSESNYVVKSVRYNGQKLDRNYIIHEELMNGGELEFIMDEYPAD